MAEVVSTAFGGGAEEERVDLTANAPTAEAAIANINAALNFG